MILNVYKKAEFCQYRKQLIEEGFEVITSATLANGNTAENLLSSNDMYAVDLSSLAKALKTSDGLLFQFERFFLSINNDKDIVFLIDEENRIDIEYQFRHIIDEIVLVDLGVDVSAGEENDGQEKAPPEVRRITDLEAIEVETFFRTFNGKLYGHDRFKEDFRKAVDTFRVFNQIGEHKVLSLFLMGDSGVGKTEVARCIHKCLDSKKKMAKINFGNYSSHDALNSLIGSPRGYIGSEGGELMQRVTESDVGLILIDEFEKATVPVFNYFLDVLENGKITNSQAEEYDISGYIIVFTSNVPKEKFSERFSPELRSRFDYIGLFNLLEDADKKKFVNFRISEITKKYEETNGTKLAKDSFRRMQRAIDVRKYSNMRDLNKKIKESFVLEANKNVEVEDT